MYLSDNFWLLAFGHNVTTIEKVAFRHVVIQDIS